MKIPFSRFNFFPLCWLYKPHAIKKYYHCGLYNPQLFFCTFYIAGCTNRKYKFF